MVPCTRQVHHAMALDDEYCAVLCCAECAVRDRIGKGFVPEVRPMGDLLAKLKSRREQVVARWVNGRGGARVVLDVVAQKVYVCLQRGISKILWVK